MSKLILFALLAVVVFSNAVLNIRYRSILNGEEQLKDPKNEYRFGIFLKSIKDIIQHNQEKHTWTKAINEFSDMTFE